LEPSARAGRRESAGHAGRRLKGTGPAVLLGVGLCTRRGEHGTIRSVDVRRRRLFTCGLHGRRGSYSACSLPCHVHLLYITRSAERGFVGSVIKKRRKRMAKKKHRKLLKKTRVQRRNKK